MSDKIETFGGEDEDFSVLFENSLKIRDDFSVGDKIEGVIVQIGQENSFVDISGKSEALIDSTELQGDDGNFIYKKGDTISAYVISIKRGEIRIGLKISSGEVSADLLHTAYENQMPVDGLVAAEVKGGFSVTVSGFRCFCPYSQIDIKSTDDRGKYINKNFEFRIIEFRENGKNIILSRRVLLEEEKKGKEEHLKKTLKTGDIVTGRVSSRHDFGIFIDLGGLEGLVPKSEISWGRNLQFSEFRDGDEIRAKIIDIDWNSNKVTLSIKQTTKEPWSNISNYAENQLMNCKVVNMISQGAFVELEPGIEGFIHISRMSHSKRIKRPEDVLKKGEFISAKILSIDSSSRKISMELVTDEVDPWQEPADNIKDSTHKGIIENVKSSGVNLRLENGMLGFIPRNDLAVPGDVQKNYEAGKELSVTVKELHAPARKLILSETGAIKKEELGDYNNFIKNNSSLSSSSLGNLFKDKFENIKKQVNEK